MVGLIGVAGPSVEGYSPLRFAALAIGYRGKASGSAACGKAVMKNLFLLALVSQPLVRTHARGRRLIVGHKRPPELIEARHKLREGKITEEDLAAIEDRTIRDVVKLQEDIGLHAVTDGESLHSDCALAAVYNEPERVFLNHRPSRQPELAQQRREGSEPLFPVSIEIESLVIKKPL